MTIFALLHPFTCKTVSIHKIPTDCKTVVPFDSHKKNYKYLENNNNNGKKTS